MKISVVIVTRNRAKLLRRAVESVINNSKTPDEIIIVNNNSSDNTKRVIQNLTKSYPKVIIRNIFEPKIGISFARNRGLKKARYDIIAFTDDDCIVDRDWIKRIIENHKLHKKVIAIGGKILSSNNKNIICYAGHLLRQYLIFQNIAVPQKFKLKNYHRLLNKKHFMTYLGTGNISYKKEKIKNMFFNTSLETGESIEFSWRLFKKDNKAILFVPNIIVYHKYRDILRYFLLRNFEYGGNMKKLMKIVKTQDYRPNKFIKKSVLSRFLNYIKFFFQESFTSKFEFTQKCYLFSLAILREIVFLFGYLFG